MNAYRRVKLFKNGRNQAVRIPREFELPGEDAIMRRDGDRLIIEPAPARSLLAVLAELAPIDESFPEIDDRPPEPGGSLTRYLLDTNILSDLIRNPQGRVAARIAEVGESAICTSIIVAAELRFGAGQEGIRASDDARSSASCRSIDVQPFDAPSDAAYAQLRVQLEAAGAPIGGNDMLIAAHALATDSAVVTANEREFSRIDGLQIENWLD